MPDRSHLSIGEVLSLLQDEFPDVTISKIRFLESQGLLDPERTPSGYRKFYEHDIERLRWVLRQQRENFLPLKVIKDRLDQLDASGGKGAPADDLALEDAAPRGGATAATPAVRSTSTAPTTTPTVADPPGRPRPSPAPAAPSRPAGAVPASASSPPLAGAGEATPLDAGPTGVSLTRDELAEACGLSGRELGELERFGLLRGRAVGPDTLYDGDALVVARTAATFLRFGIEARHLRMYKVAAEREAGFFEQVVMPLVKQRNPVARRQATENLAELTRLGEQLRAALLRTALQENTGLW